MNGLKDLLPETPEEKLKEDNKANTLVFNEDLAKSAIKGINRFNKRTGIWVLGEIKTKIQPHNYNESTYYDQNYRIYSATIGKGNDHVVIFVDGYDTVGLGDQELYLMRLNYDAKKLTIEFLTDYENDYEDIILVCEEVGIPTTTKEGYRSREELLEDLIKRQSSRYPILFKVGLGVPKDQLKKIDNCLDICMYALKCNLQKDQVIDYTFAIFIPQVNPREISPKHYMPHSPHSILFTNTKVGKSFAAHSIGELKERASEANLLGFGTANERVPGALDRSTKPFFLDEIQEEKDNQLWGKLHTFLETGSTSIGRGRGVTTNGWSSVTFMGNPKLKDVIQVDGTLSPYQQIITLDLFKSTLSRITSNYQPFGGRIGIVLFRTNLKVVKGKPANQEEQELLAAIIHTIANGYRREFTSLFHNEMIRSWLHEEFEDSYKSQLLNFSAKVSYREISEFIKGQVESYKHLKGAALRLAWLDYLSDYIKTGKIDHEAIIKLCKQHLKELQRINLESFLFITQLEETKEFKELLKSIVDNIKPAYLKFLVYTFFEWKKQNRDKRVAVLGELADYYRLVKEKVETGKYDNFFKVKDYVLNDIDKTNNVLYSFGLSLINIDPNTQAVGIDDNAKATKFFDLYFNQGSGTKGTKGTETKGSSDNTPLQVEEEHIEDTESPKSTQTPDDNPVKAVKDVSPDSYLTDIGLTDEDYVEFVRERGQNGYPKDKFVSRCDNAVLERLLRKGMLVELPAGTLRVP